jgi:DNA-binding CsgD family transcriptional regulator
LRPIAWVVVSDPETEPSLPSAQLRAAFGLTEAEARLASLIGAGEALRSAADKLGITYGTARARLAAIFEKTQTHRQGQLIKVLTAAVSPLV